MKVGLLIKNFSLLNKITRKIKNAEFNLKHLKNIPTFAHDVDVIITDKELGNSIIPYIYPNNLEILELKIRSAYYDKRNLTLGIDPGGICGLAVLSNGHVLFESEYDNINSMTQVIESINDEIGIEQIKIGMGSPPERNIIEQSLKNYEEKIFFVDEKRSGSGSHIEAAVRIAARYAYKEKPNEYRPKNGEISWIQKQSRRLSKGLITVNKKTAEMILTGKISMEDAIENYTQTLVKKNNP